MDDANSGLMQDSHSRDTLNAIAFFAVLAFPDRIDTRRRTKFFDDCVTVICGEWANGQPERKKLLSAATIKKYSANSRKRALYDNGPITMALRWIPRRLLVADAALALVANSIASRSGFLTHIRVNNVEVSNIGLLCAAIENGARRKIDPRITPGHFHQRWLKPTKPVLHVAMALHILLSKEDGPCLVTAQDMFALFLSPGWVAETLKCAHSLRDFLPTVPELRIEAADLLPLDWKIKQKLAIV